MHRNYFRDLLLQIRNTPTFKRQCQMQNSQIFNIYFICEKCRVYKIKLHPDTDENIVRAIIK